MRLLPSSLVIRGDAGHGGGYGGGDGGYGDCDCYGEDLIDLCIKGLLKLCI